MLLRLLLSSSTWCSVVKHGMLLTDNNNTDGNDKNCDNNNEDNNDNNHEKVGSYISIYMHLKHWLTMS